MRKRRGPHSDRVSGGKWPRTFDSSEASSYLCPARSTLLRTFQKSVIDDHITSPPAILYTLREGHTVGMVAALGVRSVR